MMIRAVMKDGSIFLGLDAENVKRLTDGNPIMVKAESIKVERDIFIVFGETLEDIVKEYLIGNKDQH